MVLREALEDRRRVQGPRHPSTANTLFALGKMLAAQGQTREAEAALIQAYDVRLSAYGNNHPSVREVVGYMVQYYTDLRDGTKAAQWNERLVGPQ
jgi:hypothetical protein